MEARDAAEAIRARRRPPPFRRVAVRHLDDLTPRMRRVVLGGPELDGFQIDEPAASVRLLLPPRGESTIVMPEWTGNQFELPDGERAPIRTFTPRYLDTASHELTLDLVVHGSGAASDWVMSADIGDEVAISGPGRGYEVDPAAASFLLAGDETAMPAIGQLLEALPAEVAVRVDIEIADSTARVDLPVHPRSALRWHELPLGEQPGAALIATVEGLDTVPDSVWVAGEAAAMQRIRKHLFDVRNVARSAASVRGYWKLGRSAT